MGFGPDDLPLGILKMLLQYLVDWRDLARLSSASSQWRAFFAAHASLLSKSIPASYTTPDYGYLSGSTHLRSIIKGTSWVTLPQSKTLLDDLTAWCHAHSSTSLAMGVRAVQKHWDANTCTESVRAEHIGELVQAGANGSHPGTPFRQLVRYLLSRSSRALYMSSGGLHEMSRRYKFMAMIFFELGDCLVLYWRGSESIY